ncbi:MAG TPA: hypothetical protein H9875_03195 [Candidatus Levilactobacillus faecigallinarum]|uniref:WxL domain-containing protein n=1 Tax=Candidatus Levilactobacillus faecigallinarum TaxID=2838638 RepID=A0A9D1QRG3_9LACO|nr:hypothetical protein [Candidatus Levilactobacillus faecigallinarum]
MKVKRISRVMGLLGLLLAVGVVGQTTTAHAETDAADYKRALASAPIGIDLTEYFTSSASTVSGYPNNASVVATTNDTTTKAINLTNSGNQIGSIWTKGTSAGGVQFNLAKKQRASMWLYFGQSGTTGTSANSNAAGDGMAFVLQNGGTAVSPAYGGTYFGEPLGVWGIDSAAMYTPSGTDATYTQRIAASAIQKSWALEFDTYINDVKTNADVPNGLSFDADTTNGTITQPHIASNYPGEASSYAIAKATGGSLLNQKRYATLKHNGLIQGSNYGFLADQKWHHVTLSWNPNAGDTGQMTYTFNDKNPTTGMAQASAQTATVDIDPAKLGSNNVRFGFTGSTGGFTENNFVIFEQIPNVVSASATAKLTDTTTGAEITSGATVKGNDRIRLDYRLSYDDGELDWDGLKAELTLPNNLTFSSATVAYNDGTDANFSLAGLSNQQVVNELKTLNSNNAWAKISLNGKVSNVAGDVPTATSYFRGTRAVTSAATVPFTVKAVTSTLGLTVDKPTVSVGGGTDAKVTGKITLPSGSTMTNSDLKIHATVNGKDLDTLTLSNADDLGKFSLTVPAGDLKEGDNTVVLYAVDSDGNTSADVTVVVTVGTLAFDTVSTNSSFQNTVLTGSRQTVSTKKDWQLSIKDTRAVGSQWNLYARISEPFASSGNNLSGSLVYEDTSGNINTIGTGNTLIETHAKTATDGSSVDVAGNWNTDRGMLLKLNGNNTAGTYSGQITWTLQDTPS